MDWSKLTLKVFATDTTNSADAKVYLPDTAEVQNINVSKKGNAFEVKSNPLNGKTTFKVEWTK